MRGARCDGGRGAAGRASPAGLGRGAAGPHSRCCWRLRRRRRADAAHRLLAPRAGPAAGLRGSASRRENPEVDVQWIDMGSQEVLDRAPLGAGEPAGGRLVRRAEPALPVGRGRTTSWSPITPAWADAVGEYSDPEGRYFGIYLTPEVIAYNSEAVDSASAPAGLGRRARPALDGPGAHPRPHRQRDDAHHLRDGRAALAPRDGRHGGRLRVAPPPGRADEGVRAEPHPPLPEAGAAGGAGDALGHARHRAPQGEDRLPDRLRLPQRAGRRW